MPSSIRRVRLILTLQFPQPVPVAMSISRLRHICFRTLQLWAKHARSVTVPEPLLPSTRCMRNIDLRPCWAVLFLAACSGIAQSTFPPGYAGSELCGACHEDIFKTFQKSPHNAVEADKRRGFEGRSCESCHGPGQKHIESTSAADIRNPGKLASIAADKICLSCHLNQPTHVGRLQSSHMKNQ